MILITGIEEDIRKDPVKELIKPRCLQFLLTFLQVHIHLANELHRKKMLSVLTRKDKIPLAYVCCVGAQTDLIFDGASMCFDADGNLVHLGKTFEEDFILFDTKKKYDPIEKCESTFEEEIYTSLVFGLKEYCSKLGFKKVLSWVKWWNGFCFSNLYCS